MSIDNASYSAGYRAGIKFGEKSVTGLDSDNDPIMKVNSNPYKAGYKDGTRKALEDIKLNGEYKLAYNDGLKGANDDSAYRVGYKAGTKYGLEKAGSNDKYAEGYRMASRTAPRKSVENTLTRLLHKVDKLGNHSSVLMVKHEIKKELEAVKQKELGIEHGMSL